MVIVLPITILYWTILGVFSSSLSGIFVAALYYYATTGKIPSAYSQELVRTDFIKKRML